MFFCFIIYLWDVNWIKTFSIVIIKSENLDLKFNIYCIWTEKNQVALIEIINIYNPQNVNKITINLGVLNPVKLNHLNQMDIILKNSQYIDIVQYIN